jgi:hypothetical protein
MSTAASARQSERKASFVSWDSAGPRAKGKGRKGRQNEDWECREKIQTYPDTPRTHIARGDWDTQMTAERQKARLVWSGFPPQDAKSATGVSQCLCVVFRGV